MRSRPSGCYALLGSALPSSVTAAANVSAGRNAAKHRFAVQCYQNGNSVSVWGVRAAALASSLPSFLLGVFPVLFGCLFLVFSRVVLPALGLGLLWLVAFAFLGLPPCWFVGSRLLRVVRRLRSFVAARRFVSLPCPPCRWRRAVSASAVSFLPGGGLAVAGCPVGRRVGVAPARVVRSSGVVLSFWVFGRRA